MPAALDRGAPAWRELAQHWETWVGVLLCGLCGATGGYVSIVYFQRSPIPVLLGGVLGGYLYSLMVRLVRTRYGSPSPGTSRPLANAVDLYFRDGEGGRLMVPDGPRGRYGYRIHSPEQERLLRAYLSMRLWAQTAIMLLGVIGAWFALDLPRRWNAMATPGDGALLVMCGVLVYFVLLVLPVLLLGRVSRQIEAQYFSAAERVTVAPLPNALTARRLMLALLALGVLTLAAGLLLALMIAGNHR